MQLVAEQLLHVEFARNVERTRVKLDLLLALPSSVREAALAWQHDRHTLIKGKLRVTRHSPLDQTVLVLVEALLIAHDALELSDLGSLPLLELGSAFALAREVARNALVQLLIRQQLDQLLGRQRVLSPFCLV